MSNRIFDTNGWFEIPANPITRVGVFPYLGSSIAAPIPDKMYQVLRSAEELSNPEFLNSLRLMPFVWRHAMLGNLPTPDQPYIPAEVKGVHGVIGDNVWFSPDDATVYGNLKVWSQVLSQAIDKGERELSLGYKSKYDWTPGVWNGKPYDCRQINLRGNHMALVPDGRMGDDVAVLDNGSVVRYDVFTFDEKDAKPMIGLKKSKPKVYDAFVKQLATTIIANSKLGKEKKFAIAAMDADDASSAASDPSLADVAELLGDVLPQISDINDSLNQTSGAGSDDDMEDVLDASGMPVMDAATGKPQRKKKAAAAQPAPGATQPTATVDASKKEPTGTMDAATFSAAMDAAVTKAVTAAIAPLVAENAKLQAGIPARVYADMAKRDALVGQLKPFIGVFDSAEMTLEDVAKYGARTLGLPVVAGQEYGAVSAYLHNRQPPHPTHTVIATTDAAAGGAASGYSVADYLSGKDMTKTA